MAAEKDECIELKNIKYKTMLLSGKMAAETKSSSDLTNLEKFLEDDKNSNQSYTPLNTNIVGTIDYLRQGQLISNEFFRANNPLTF